MMSRCWSGSLQLKEWIHIKETEHYCPGSHQWTTLMLSPFTCCPFGITAHGTMLYLAGGGLLQNMQKKDSVFLYDTEGQVWRKASPLPKVLVDHSSCMIKLHQVNAAGETGRGRRCSPATGRKKSTLGSFISKKQDSHSASQKK